MILDGHFVILMNEKLHKVASTSKAKNTRDSRYSTDEEAFLRVNYKTEYM